MAEDDMEQVHVAFMKPQGDTGVRLNKRVESK